MKICVVLNGLEQGGVTSSALNFCEELAKKGNVVDLIDMCNGNAIDSKNINLYHIPRVQSFWNLDKNKLNEFSLMLRPLLLLVAFFKKITNRKGYWLPLIFSKYRVPGVYDVVIAYRQCAPCYYFSIKCVCAKKRVAMIHGDVDYMGDISSWSDMLQNFDRIACVSKAVTEGFQKTFPMISNRIVTMYNMFDIKGIKSKSLQDCSICVNHNCINIVTVARHENNHKKVNRIAEICAVLKKRSIENFHWYVIGAGPDFDVNVEMSKCLGVDNLITYCGGMNNPYPLIAQCDFMVLTSLTEAYGMVVIEGRILGLPSIVAKYPSLSEIIIDGKNGIIAQQDINDIADSIVDVLNNKHEKLNYMRRYVLENSFSNDVAMSQAYEILNIRD